MSKAIEFLIDSNTQREAEQYLESLLFADKAILAFQQEKNLLRVAESFAARSITFKLLYRQTHDKLFLVLATSAASTAVSVARHHGEKSSLAIPLFGLAKTQAEAEDHKSAIISYQEAIEIMENQPPVEHDKPEVLADMKVHLAVSQYKAGDTSVTSTIYNAIKVLESSDLSYERNAWLSGAYMRLAELLKSKDHLIKAKEIIDSDPRLTIRLKQWTELSSKLK
ncbi:hypothetical protein KJ953_01035 [Patescibacteria group bacterium]|nr:hypothetical protein [Patescibacteria group bacterium]MBU1256417.1 hypothetical protein [Patescibacteria group bacterium]MBU1457339.1 hypothetical protein [Patescibacteria group bacterium]